MTNYTYTKQHKIHEYLRTRNYELRQTDQTLPHIIRYRRHLSISTQSFTNQRAVRSEVIYGTCFMHIGNNLGYKVYHIVVLKLKPAVMFSVKICIEEHWFLPEASFGLRVLSLPASVRVGVNHELVRAITCHWFQLESPNLNKTCKTSWLRSRLFWGLIDLDLQGRI